MIWIYFFTVSLIVIMAETNYRDDNFSVSGIISWADLPNRLHRYETILFLLWSNSMSIACSVWLNFLYFKQNEIF